MGYNSAPTSNIGQIGNKTEIIGKAGFNYAAEYMMLSLRPDPNSEFYVEADGSGGDKERLRILLQIYSFFF